MHMSDSKSEGTKLVFQCSLEITWSLTKVISSGQEQKNLSKSFN